MDNRNNHHVGRCVTSTCGNFSVGDIKYYDGTSASQPSKAVKDLLRYLSVTVKPHCNSDSVFPYTASDVGIARDKDLVAFEMDMLAFLSGCTLVKVVDGAIVNYMCPEGGCHFSIKFGTVRQNNPREMLRLVGADWTQAMLSICARKQR